MTDHIEQRLLALAEKATPAWNAGQWSDEYAEGVPDVDGAPTGRTRLLVGFGHPVGAEDYASMAALSELHALPPPTVSRLARAIATGRALLDNLSLHGSCPATNCDSEDATGLDGLRDPEPHSEGCAYVAALEAYRALDADSDAPTDTIERVRWLAKGHGTEIEPGIFVDDATLRALDADSPEGGKP